MISWHLFCEEIKQLTFYHYVWPDALPSNIQTALTNFDQLCLNRLCDLLQLPLADNEREYRLRRFFAMRWQVVINTSLDYTLNPGLPTNQLLLRIAKQIAKTEEAVCLILMPTIQAIIGSDLPNDIKYASEDLQNQFHPHYFLINADGTALLSLEDIFSYAIHDTDFLFPVLIESDGDDKKIKFDLSAKDVERIRMVSQETMRLCDYLQKNHRIRYNHKPSVGYALKLLQIALLKSSKIEKGSDVAANMNECQRPINAFYEIWCALPVDIKNQIGQYKISGATVTLQDYLLCVFAHTSGIELSVEEFARVRGDIVPCTHMIGSQLREIVNQHAELNGIPLPGMEKQFSFEQVYDHELLTDCFQSHLTQLKNNRVMVGENNKHIFDCHAVFYQLTAHWLDVNRMAENIAAINISSMVEFLLCLDMIPKEHWHIFLSSFDGKKDVSYFNFIALVKNLRSNDWSYFFALIFDKNLGDQLDTAVIANVLSEISEFQHATFINAISRYIDVIFSEAIDIFYLLASTEIHNWLQVVNYFQEKITLILKNPGKIIALFKMIPCDDWSSLYALFRNIIRAHLVESDFLEILYMHCVTLDRKRAIISVIFDDMDWLVTQPVLFANVLNHADIAEWKTVFSLLSPENFKRLIATIDDLFVFLIPFKQDDLRSIVIYCLRDHLARMPLVPNRLSHLIVAFPGCQNILISIFRKQLPSIFSDYLRYFALVSKTEIHASIRKDFLFSVQIALPLLLSSKMIAEQCESFRKYHDDYPDIKPDFVFRLYRQLRVIERKMLSQQISRESASIEKLKLLSEYVIFSKTMRRTKTPFYKELIAFYGEDFFDSMLLNCKALIQVRGIGLFSSSCPFFCRDTNASLVSSTRNSVRLMRSASLMSEQSMQNIFVRGLRVQLQPRS